MEKPLVSVIVINFNKLDVLRRCLQSVVAQEWPQLEVIVVDNASEDGSADMVETEFSGRVSVIRRTVNSPTAARNDGYRAAGGRYLLSLDNDIVLSDATVIAKGVALFEEFPGAGALAFRIGTVEDPTEPLIEHWWHPLPIAEAGDSYFYTDYFGEGAVFLRPEVVEATGGYDPLLFRGFECADFILKIFGAGYDILYCPDLSCGEIEVRGYLHQRRAEINYLTLRNKLWVAWKHYPLGRALRFAVPRVAASALRALRYGWPDLYLRALWDGIFARAEIRAQRRPLPPGVWRRLAEVREGQRVERASPGE
jgi:hypothetical protein